MPVSSWLSFLPPLYPRDQVLETLTTQKCQWVQTKKTPPIQKKKKIVLSLGNGQGHLTFYLPAHLPLSQIQGPSIPSLSLSLLSDPDTWEVSKLY